MGPFFWLDFVNSKDNFNGASQLGGQKKDPIFGVQKNGIFPFFLEAVAFFKWANHALSDADKPLCINMDETSLLLKPLLAAGSIATKTGIDQTSLATKRARCTLLASICTDSAIQPLLPQIIVCNERFFGKRQKMPKLLGTLVWVQKSAWASHVTIKRYLRLLGSILKKAAPSRKLILVMDLAPAHMHRSIPSTARQENLRLLFIPPGLTSWLQPADVGCFGPLKTQLEILYRELKASNADGEISKLEWLNVVDRAVKKVLPSVKWQRIFEKCGILGQKFLPQSLLTDFGWLAPPHVPTGPPSEEEAQLLFPRRRTSLDVMALVLWRAVRLHRGRVIRTLD